MTILLVEAPVNLLSIDEENFPDRDESQILGHLIHYFRKFDPLPAVTVAIENDAAKVLRGHKYLIAARTLGRPSVRAVVASPPSSEEVKRFLARLDVTLLDWAAIKAAEEQNLNPKGWHVFFFAHPLSQEQKAAFDRDVRALFVDPTLPIVHDDDGPVAEFEAATPVADRAWAARHLSAFARFHHQQVPIVSYQGRRFPGSESAATPSALVR